MGAVSSEPIAETVVVLTSHSEAKDQYIPNSFHILIRSYSTGTTFLKSHART